MLNLVVDGEVVGGDYLLEVCALSFFSLWLKCVL